MVHSYKYFLILCWLIGFIFLLAGFAHARSDVPQTLIDRDTALVAAKKATAERYPDADTILVEGHTWLKYHEDGTYVQRDESYQKVLTQEGVDALKSLSSWFTIPYNTTRFVFVEVIRPDGSVLPVDVEANARVMIDRGQMDSNIYNPDDKILSVNLPELRVGDVVHYTLEDVFAKVRIPGSFSELFLFENTAPILHKICTVTAPASLPLQRTALRSPVGTTVTQTTRRSGDTIVYTWEGKDIPQAFPEPDMPAFYTVNQRILLSTIPDWEWISRWYWNLSKPHLDQVTPAMKVKVAELIQGVDTPSEQIRALFTWVSQEVRYLGLTLEKNAPGYEPHPVDMTFDRRAGVCRDKAALLVAMLRLAGFDAYPVLIMSGPKKDPEVAQPFFNHAVTTVRMKDGTYLLMDPTDEHSRELFPPYLNNCSYLVATPTGDSLRTSPSVAARNNLLKIITTAKLHEDGGMTASSSLRFLGINDSAYRGFFARTPEEKQRSYFENALKKGFPGAVLTAMKVLPENIMDTSATLEVRLDFQVPRVRVNGEKVVMLPLPVLGENLGVARMLIDKMGLEKRRYPLFTRYACGVDEEMTLDLGGDMGPLLSAPVPVAWNSSEMTFDQSFAVRDNLLTARRVFTLNLPEYTPGAYLGLKQTLEKREREQRGKCIFAAKDREKESDASWYAAFDADAVILNEDVTYTLESEHAWVREDHVRTKILTYAGKKKNSEISIDYTPAWEDVHIARATVTGADGSVKTIEPQEINRMDASWVGEAPRYPAAKTLVASLPGVEEGSVLDYTIVHSVHDRSFFSMVEFMTGEYPVVGKNIRVIVPQNVHVRVLQSDQGWGLASSWVREPENIITSTRTHAPGNVAYGFRSRRVRPVVQEQNLPPQYSYQPTVAMTSGTWEGYAGELYGHLHRAALEGKEAGKKAEELVAGVSKNLEKIRIIRDFVARSIAHAGPSLGDGPLQSISLADTTLKEGYGNSADTAVLLYAMLTAIGSDPAFVIGTNASPVPALQGFMHGFVSPRWLDDVLVRVRGGEEDLYLNDTDEYAVTGSTPHDGTPGLVLPGGEIQVVRAAENMRDRNGFEYVIDLQENGDALISNTTTFWGMEYNARHRMLAEMSPETSRRYELEQASGISLNAELTNATRNFEDYPGRETLTVRVKNFGTRQGDFLYLNLPGMLKGLAGVDGATRVNPLYRDFRKYGTSSVRIHLPAATQEIEMLPARTFTVPIADGGRISVRTSRLPSREGVLGHLPTKTVAVDVRMEIDPFVVPPTSYGLVREAEDILVRQAHGTLMLRLTGDRP